jgi:CRISPR-associated protein Cas1
MIEKIIDISEGPAKLNSKYEQLIITHNGESHSIPINEISVVLISTPTVSISSGVISLMCKNNGMIVVCDEKYMPVGVLLPYETNYVQQERFYAQIQASMPIKKQLWKQIITSKITSQGVVLKKMTGSDKGLFYYSSKVASGDSANIEGYAARIYWKELFGEEFRRNPEEIGINSMLNYGYTILRAMTTRAICSAGLHPSFGIHHHNKYNSYCLADDLMEPFRPIVDEYVFNSIKEKPADIFLTKETKRNLVKHILDKEMYCQGQIRKINDILNHYAVSLVGVYLGRKKSVMLPKWEDDRGKE